MSLLLYQFPLSHFCEKVRWALEYKGLDYTKKNLIPGPHVKVTTRLSSQSSVPLLKHNDKVVQGSGNIITYLDEQFPNKKLTPVDTQARQTAMEWERFLDQEVGVHLRRYFYYTVLEHRSLAIDLLTYAGPKLTKILLWLAYPKLETRMRKFMDINPTSAEESKQRLIKALDRVNGAVASKNFLAGGDFSRADLTASALLAPFFMPKKFELNWPSRWPDPLQSFVESMEPQLRWVEQIYASYR